MGKRRSDTWNNFTYIDGIHAECDICKQRLSYRSSITNLKKHLTRKHPGVECGIPSAESCVEGEYPESPESAERESDEEYRPSSEEEVKTRRVTIKTEHAQQTQARSNSTRKRILGLDGTISTNGSSSHLNSLKRSRLSSISERQGSARKTDEFTAFSDYIASKLRRLDRRTCSHVEKAISDLVFQAEMGKYPTEPDPKEGTVYHLKVMDSEVLNDSVESASAQATPFMEVESHD